MTGLGRIAVAVVIIGLLMGAAIELQRLRDRSFPVRPVEDDSLYLTSPSSLRRMALAYRAVAADLYWIRALQYFGGTRRMVEAGQTITDPNRRRYAALFPLLDLTTSLDPRFNLAYRFGAIFLAEPAPRGPARPDLAIALLMKGLAERPDRWEYMQDIGFVHYWWRQDYKAAAEWFRRASEVPGAPWWLKSLSATTLAQGGDRLSSRMMWEAIRQSAEIDWLRHDAERHLGQLRALDEIDALQAIVNRVASQSAQPVLDWRPVMRAAGWRTIPVDPAGIPYEIDERGRVQVSRSSPLWPMPAGPPRIDVAPPPS
ncbi:MAG: hypothetical protein AUF76_00815 [Acidobacteria bacterium 13_1_20CM_2_65_9]|nr:MAG: hypothetical protein AUF76_00815 [Acidobacteria bacterium 13_1_20CM_2_65_9]